MNSILIQGPCDEGEIFTLDWENPQLHCNAICERNEVALKQDLIGGLLICPDGQQLDTRGVCKDVTSASEIFNNRLVLCLKYLINSFFIFRYLTKNKKSAVLFIYFLLRKKQLSLPSWLSQFVR